MYYDLVVHSLVTSLVTSLEVIVTVSFSHVFLKLAKVVIIDKSLRMLQWQSFSKYYW